MFCGVYFHTNKIQKINFGCFFFVSEDNDAIGLELFETYVKQMHVDGDFGFAQLYEEITAATKSFSYSSDVSLHEFNRCKNRYSNILTCSFHFILPFFYGLF